MDGNNKCAICLEVLKDPRILPCWHGACFECIKQMRRTSNGRLVTCHMCREVCSYENVDSLPAPISCELCKNFVVNPRQFPCCNRLCCTDCLRMATIDGVVYCPKKCSETLKYSVHQLPQARICPECFKLHNADGHDCGHYFCTDCTDKYGIEGSAKNNCKLCAMKADPMIGQNWEDGNGFRDRQDVDELLYLLRQLRMPDSERTVQQCLEVYRLPFDSSRTYKDCAKMDDRSPRQCSICLEELRDPRILPCWHSACFTCILGMTQLGQGRTVACHICRSTLLFENIRSLPNPIPCRQCGNFIISPRKFPCCNCLCCSACIQSTLEEGLTTCPNQCAPDDKYAMDDLPLARICSICFTLHTEEQRQCQHFLCKNCSSTLGDRRNCDICLAAANPPPMPVNPLINNLPADFLRLPIHPLGAGQLDVERLQNFIRLLAVLQQQQPQQPGLLPIHNHEQQVQQQRELEQNTRNGVKLLCFAFILVCIASTVGLSIWMWIAGATVMIVTRFDLKLCFGTCSLTFLALLLISFYHFYHAVILCMVNMIGNCLLVRIHPLMNVSWFILVQIAIIIYLEPIFVHKAILECFILVVYHFAKMRGINLT